jgi:hypothetical protein
MVLEAWISARVGGGQTGPTRAPNRRLPAARADNPLRAPISAVLTVLGELPLDAPLLDHRVGAGHAPTPPIRRKAAPKQQRQHQTKRPCARHCCYGSRINGNEEPAPLEAVYTRTTYSD